MSTLVSIVIPVYNAAAYVNECLQSVRKQTHAALDIIVINDGSTDTSEEIIRNHMSEDKRIRYFHQENHGLGYTRNRGIELSQGKYVFFLDSDDLVPAAAIGQLVNAAEKEGAEIAVGKVLRLTKQRLYPPLRHIDFNLYKKDGVTTLKQSPELLQDSIACNKLWKRSFLIDNELAFTVGKYYEDLALTLKGPMLANKIAVIKDPVYFWRIREEDEGPSITQRQMELGNTRDRVNALLSNTEWLENTGAPAHIKAEHDLKALLDVLRLHVVKYALIAEGEKQEWERLILDFMKRIPTDSASRLTGKEKLMYTLLAEEKLKDLELLSKMLSDTEERQIVAQNGSSFALTGDGDETYDVTSLLKPELKMTSVETDGQSWVLSGTATLPKASQPTTGKLTASDRKKSGQTIEIQDVEMIPSAGASAIYPYESQTMNIRLTPELFPDPAGNATYDFFFALGEDHDTHIPARVRIEAKAIKSSRITSNGNTYALYRTEYGNLSLLIERKTMKYFIKKIVRYVKRRVK